MERPKAKKPLKRYGSVNRDVFEFHGDSDGELDKILRKDLISSGAKPKRQAHDAEAQKASMWALSSGDTEVIGSEDRHMPAATHGNADISLQMPPPAIKPISFEQTQSLEPRTLHTADSMPFTSTPANSKTTEEARSLKLSYSDDRMPTPTMSSRGRGDGEQVSDTGGTDGSRKRPRLDMEVPEQEHAGLPEPSSSASIISPSKTITVTKSTRTTEPLPGDDTIGEDELHSKVCPHSGAETINPIVLLPQYPQYEEGQDELSLSISDPDPESKIQKRTTIDRKGKETHDPVRNELGSDDAAIGLPKDQYQPRPSESRSGRNNEELFVPADYSKRPEAVAKKKRKFQRRKTTAFQELIPKDEDDDEDEDFVKQPSLEIPKRKALKVLEDSEEDKLDTTKNEDDTHLKPTVEHVPAAKAQGAKKQRGRPKKEVNEPSKNITVTEKHVDPDHEDGEPLKAVTADSSKDKTSERKDSNPDHEVAAPEKPVPAPKEKRGGKKSKTSETPVAISEELVHDSDDELGAPEVIRGAPRKALNGTEGNSMAPKATEETASSPPPPETPRKASSATPKGPDKHSPISSGKVAYRVGLSKRARIEPLLRIVRKC